MSTETGIVGGTSHDAFLGGGLTIEQPVTGYRAGLDAVLLAAACPTQAGERVLDAGAGVGVVGLCVARRVTGATVTLVEREPSLATLAGANVMRNGLADRVTVVTADLAQPLSRHAVLAALVNGFHHVLANPPYHVDGRGTAAADPLKAGSHAMAEGSLDDWARFMAAMAMPDGTLTMVHRADKLDEILAVLDRRFGGLVVRPIYPRAGEAASRVLISGKKASRAPLTIAPGLVLHEPKGFRPDIEAVLRHGAALVL